MPLMECRGCSAPLDASRVDPRLKVISCDRCGSVFNWSEDGAPVLRAAAPLPVGFEMETHEGRLRISWPFSRSNALFLGIFGLPMALMPFAVLFGVMGSDAEGHGVSQACVMVCIAPLMLLGVVVINAFIAALINVHILEAGTDEVAFRARPMPWRKPRPIPVDEIDQIYVSNKGVKGSVAGVSFKTEAQGWNILVRTASGDSRVLIDGLDSPEAALYIEQQLEDHLGLTDRIVDGDYRNDS